VLPWSRTAYSSGSRVTAHVCGPNEQNALMARPLPGDDPSGGHGRLRPDLLARIRSVVSEGDTIWTVATGKRNLVVGISPNGVLVETDRSIDKGLGAQLVPAALINQDWEWLRSTGRLRLQDTSHRGSFNCALFSLFPEVQVRSTRPVELQLTGGGS